MKLKYINNRQTESSESNAEFSVVCDVCVVGLGTAGAMAALSAADCGASVIGIEKLMQPGGTGTVGGVYGYFFGSSGGKYESIDADCAEMLTDNFICTDKKYDKSSFPGFVKEYVIDSRMRRSGICIRYDTVVTGVFMDEEKVLGIQVLHNGRLENIGAKVVIDCTGEAQVCRICGCEFMPGRRMDNRMAKSAKLVGLGKNNYEYMDSVGESGMTDWSDAEQNSESILSILESKSWAGRDDYSDKKRILFSSEMIGNRECHCVRTEREYLFGDYISGHKTENPLFYAFGPVDNVNQDIAFESEEYQNWLFCTMSGYGFSVGVSKEMLIPRGVDGLLVAGKGIGVGHDLAMLVRMKRDMQKCGEAAGVIAHLAARDCVSVRNVEYDLIKEMLEDTGCFCKENDLGLRNLKKKSGGIYEKAVFPKNINDLKQMLSKENYGTGLWYAFLRYDEKTVSYLRKWSKSEDESLKINSAIVLAMQGDDFALDTVRSILLQTPEMPSEIWEDRYYLNFAKAIALCGRFRDEAAIDVLCDIVRTDGKKYVSKLKGGTYFYRTAESFAAQFVALAIVALINIADTSKRRGEISDMLGEWVSAEKENAEIEAVRQTTVDIIKNMA